MQGIATKNSIVLEGRLLANTIANLQGEFASMKTKLREKHHELARLRKMLAGIQAKSDELPEIDYGSLRRRTAFFCHPDRGGDQLLMQRLNVLFDFLESLRKTQFDLAPEGVAS